MAVVLEAGSVGREHEQGGLQLAGLRVLGAGHDEDRLRVVDAGHVVLATGEQPVAAVAPRGRRDAVRVGTGVGLGDAEGHDRVAARESGQPALLLLRGAEPADDRAVDRRRHHHHQQAAAGRVELLPDDGQLVHASAAAAVLLGQVEADEAGLAGFLPQFGERFSRARPRRGVLVAVTLAELGDRLAQRELFFGFAEIHGHSPSLTTASTAPTSICWPTATGSSVTTPSVGALIWCCIFIASSHSTG